MGKLIYSMITSVDGYRQRDVHVYLELFDERRFHDEVVFLRYAAVPVP